jgi:hypothetical protein
MPLPRNLLGRVVVRVLAFEYNAYLALALTTAAIVSAFARWWGWAAFAGVAAFATWGYIVRDEAQARREDWPDGSPD